MKNKLLSLLMLAGLANNSQIFSSETGEEFDELQRNYSANDELRTGEDFDESVRNEAYYEETDDDKKASVIPPATRGLRQAVFYNYIEKPHWLTGDTLHERKIISSNRTDLIDNFSRRRATILHRNRIVVNNDYCYLPSCSHCPIRHVNAHNYLRCPNNIEIPNRILTKPEYQNILATALAFSQEHDDEDYIPYNKQIDHDGIYSNGRIVYEK